LLARGPRRPRPTPPRRSRTTATAARLWDSLHAIDMILERELPIIRGWFEQVHAAMEHGGAHTA
jgi:hypothetical protein